VNSVLTGLLGDSAAKTDSARGGKKGTQQDTASKTRPPHTATVPNVTPADSGRVTIFDGQRSRDNRLHGRAGERRAQREAGLRHARAACLLHCQRDAEVGDQRLTIVQQDVLRLDVARWMTPCRCA
jgi:hypothetical protein